MLLCITAPADNDRGPLYMDQAFAAIHAANAHHAPLTFGMARIDGTVCLHCDVPASLRSAVEGQIAAVYPTTAITRLRTSAFDVPLGWRTWETDLWLQRGLFPIRRYPQFEDTLNRTVADPLTGILMTLTGDESVVCRIDIVVRPARHREIRRTHRVLERLARPFFRHHPVIARGYAQASMSRWQMVRRIGWLLGFCARRPQSGSHPHELTTTSTRTHDREDDLQAAADKLGRRLFEARVHLSVTAPPDRAAAATTKLHEMEGAFGQFTVPRLSMFRSGRVRARPSRSPGRGFLLSCQELATLWHPPTAMVKAERTDAPTSKEMEPPITLPLQSIEPDLAVLGRVHFRRRTEVFGLPLGSRRRHTAVIGKTGVGKSTLLLSLLASDIRAGRGTALIDPHGDLAEAVLATVPPHRTNEVVLFDAGDRAHPLAFNPLACSDANSRPLVASGVVSSFKKLFQDSWGPRLEHILRNALLAVLEGPAPSLLVVQRMLHDAGFRKTLAGRVSDPLVRSFWQSEYVGWSERYRTEAIAPLENKLGHFLSNPILRSIVGQAKNSLDLRSILDAGRVLIVNLSKGRIGDDASSLLGSLLVTSFQLAAMARADQPEADRRDFFLYVDEFQNFATESFATILSEARKYRVSLVVANQYLAQMDAATLEAVFGNVGNLLVFQAGARDSEALAEQLGGDVTPQDVMQLPRYHAYVRLLIDGAPSRPFSMHTLPPLRTRDPGRSETIRRTSRQRYNREATAVQAEIARSLTHA